MLKGICNQCGLCCFAGDLRCHYLEIIGIPGLPGAARCKVYDRRVPGMPIMMLTPDGKVGAVGSCAHGTPYDDLVIIEKGIGKGCSLKLA